ncbi:similar to Saccharomyces cerevisiae YFL002C SPB4 Putative ATP-dependent RNA helicase, nucleolar protein required for synthesis of 60S ribosomal subunits at a late step in the pathway [Maudiozyma saulgeensis]|uniref:ATP-dependent RNA helicase n=1 Tax=Maudiozyma saulgeensis TaxID=1789683 RepID=A0A1X7R395_9SACH|nr:similar to Saccharomyces cerevisiae YFL002C SPB4 Putative ATP-dependent RNA helicase, nucleolar protein required for synthesis of 60S ribosomal subunits at a late step in the pathway [Kazachstania saulgeensis]
MSKSLEWDSLQNKLQPWIRTAVDVMGFEHMTPVQASTIPLLTGNKDVVVDSVTGSGKTVAFVVPILERIVTERAAINTKKGHFHTLILSPTRELAKQIQAVIDSFLDQYPEETAQKHPIKSQLIVGTDSMNVRDDVNFLLENRPLILIGTPGRVLEFFQDPRVKTTSCNMSILDEADRLLDSSFLGDVEKILRILPKQRRTGLFSATIKSAGNDIFKTGLRNPVKITVNSKVSAPSTISFNYCLVKPQEKLQQLLHILENYRFKKCIVYFPTCISVQFFYSFITYLQKKESSSNYISNDIGVYSLHGKLQTSSRMKTLTKFTEDLTNSVLLTTDVAARGIDIPDVDLVIQMDPPTDTDHFLHRCGRTGRLNRIGKAITFLNQGREEDYIDFLEIKNIILKPANELLAQNPDNEKFYNEMKSWLLKDRARFDHAVRSYVAFIRYYSNHSASSIFRLQTLDYVGLCKLYGLFRLPRMPEITKNFKDEDPLNPGNKITFGDGWLVDPPIDINSFAYIDPKREQARLKDLANLEKINDKKKLKFELKKKNMAWSNNSSSKEVKTKRREKMQLKRKAIEEELARNGGDSGSDDESNNDWKNDILESRKKRKQHNDVQGQFDDL